METSVSSPVTKKLKVALTSRKGAEKHFGERHMQGAIENAISSCLLKGN